MKRFLSAILITFFVVNINITNAASIKINIDSSNIITNETELDRSYIFDFFASYFYNSTPESYKYINLNFNDINLSEKDTKSLKTLIYHDLIQNTDSKLNLYKKLDAYSFYKVSEKIFEIELELDKDLLKSRNTNYADIKNIKKIITEKSLNIIDSNDSKTIQEKKSILEDVYKTILESHYDKDNLTEIDILNSAIEGVANGAGDKHTVYFPPVEFKDFNQQLDGEYEGIGSYVDMPEPGVFVITSPIPGGPAEIAGLKGGDIVTKVDGKEITKDHHTNEIISWIKGPAGTFVTLTIDRDGKELEIKVKRDTIILKNIESEIMDSKTYYIQIKSFGQNISDDFKAELEKIKENTRINKIIIDLRNNGGGYLNEVTEMLGYFIDKGEATAVVRYQGSTQYYKSQSENIIDLNDYDVVILQNSGTASASEIMIGTLKDYFENVTTIGENTYGKGSVQTLKKYRDGSSLKYTIAKWFTGKTETGIDGIGIAPDIELELDIEKYQERDYDNQLEKALYLR